MNSNEPIFLPERQNVNRQAWTCVAVADLVGCAAVVILGLVLCSLVPKDILACTGWLPQNISVDEDGQIAFVSDRDGNPEIYVINTDGSAATRYTDNPAGDYAPAWSPDGTRIAFYSERDGNAEIYIINADGSGLTRLTNDPANDYAPAWSPDGKQIAFHSHRYQGAGRIFVMNTDGSGVTRLTDPAWDDWAPAWSSDGTQIVFNSSRNNNRDIWLMNADGAGVSNLTSYSANDWAPAWSPEGTRSIAKPVEESENTAIQKEEPTPVIESADPGTDLARRKEVQVSRALASNPAGMAVDENLDNWWGAGDFAPQWIEIDLGANYMITSSRLLPSQSPAGETVHRLLVKGPATGNSYEILHTFQGTTVDFK